MEDSRNTGEGSKDRSGHRTKSQNERPTVGLMTWGLEDTIGYDMWTGVVDAAQERGANVICFVSGVLAPPAGPGIQANVLYDLVSTENVDGLVMWSALVQQVPPEELRAFYERYRPLPMVSVGLPLQGIPSVLVNNYQGMHDEIVHLVEVHGYRRIAFIRGPENDREAEDRYRAYTDVLAEYGLPLEPALAVSGDNQVPSGAAAMRLLLDEQELHSEIGFEAVVASNDNMAFGALEVLETRGMQVPGDVAVVGFDDVVEAQSIVPITTVRYPFYELGRRAVEMLLALLAGEEVPERETLPLELAVRRSCGCLAPAVVQAAVGQVKKTGQVFEAIAAAKREDILSEIAQSVGVSSVDAASGWAEQLLDGFTADLESESPGAFLFALDEVLRRVMAAGEDVAAWQRVLSVLRRQALPGLEGQAVLRAEDLWQQARVMIGQAAQRARMHREWQFEQRDATVREISQALVATADVAYLMDALAQELPRVGILSCYLSLYEDPEAPADWSRLALAYDENGRGKLEEKRRRFPSRRLAPEGMLRRDKCFSMLVQALHFREDQLGFVLFKVGTPGDLRQAGIYEVLRGQISSALHGTMLAQQLQNRALKLQTTAEVSSAAGSILEPDTLTQQVVDLVRERFGLYYVGLFLVDQTGEWTRDRRERLEPGKWAVLRSGTGEAGRQMVAQGHRLEVGGKSMVGQCVAKREARIALDVTSASSVESGAEAVRFDNPMLPETHSELALPLISRGQSIGALTIQSTEVAAFMDEDIAVLQTMAGQLANAIENAHLFEQTQAALRQMETTQRRYIQQAWEEYTSMPDASQSFFHSEDKEGPITEAWRPVVEAAVQQGDAAVRHEKEDGAMLAVPLTVHGEVMGVLGGHRPEGQAWNEDEVAEIEDIVEQLALALESQRLFDGAQRATFLMGERVRELDFLNAVGRKMEEIPSLPEFLQWVAEQLPGAMRHSDVCLAVVEFEGQVYGRAEAMNLSRQMVQTLRVGGETVGRIYMAYTEEYDFLDEESALLGDVARRVSGYVEGRRLLRETESRAGELAMLNEMGRALSEMLDVRSVVESLYQYTSHLIDTTNFYIALYDTRTDEVSFPLAYEHGERRQWGTRRAGEGLTEYLIRSREPLLIEENVAERLGELGIDVIGQEALSWLGVPLMRGGQVVGVVAVQSYTTPRLYGEHDRDLLSAIANQVAIAIENARLLEQARARAERERLVRAIVDKVRRGVDTEAIMRVTLQELGQMLGASRSVVRLGTQEQLLSNWEASTHETEG